MTHLKEVVFTSISPLLSTTFNPIPLSLQSDAFFREKTLELWH